MNFLTATEAAERLGVCRQMVHYLIRTNQLKATWMLGRWAIDADEITRYKRRRTRLKVASATA